MASAPGRTNPGGRANAECQRGGAQKRRGAAIDLEWHEIFSLKLHSALAGIPERRVLPRNIPVGERKINVHFHYHLIFLLS